MSASEKLYVIPIQTALFDSTRLFCRHDCILLPNGEDILVFGGTIFSTVYNVRSGRSLYGIDTILSRDHGRAVALGRRVLVLGGDSLTNRVEEFLPEFQV